VDWSSLANFILGLALLGYSLQGLATDPRGEWRLHPVSALLYPAYLLCGVGILYSLMIALAATSIWLGRNQTLYDFWFYITNFSRYPMEIYAGRLGSPLRWTFTYLVPVLVVVNVPARLLALPLAPDNLWLCGFAVVAACGSFLASRALFQRALEAYRSASS
jgi:ABC-2 type transport system permease protein